MTSAACALQQRVQSQALPVESPLRLPYGAGLLFQSGTVLVDVVGVMESRAVATTARGIWEA